MLRTRELMLVTAESCTGGWIAKAVTDIAGSSGWFERGVVCYSNDAKVETLGVSPRTLDEHGAVSRAVAVEMARGALVNRRAHVSIAVTGVAGPGGGTATKPVGLVWLAWSRRGGRVETRSERFPGDREAVRRGAVEAALRGLLEFVD